MSTGSDTPKRFPGQQTATTVEVRPTLIIGLGGTGVLIAQWAYLLIHELFGSIPPFIRFLGLDSDAQEDGGPVRLPAADFINLFSVPGLRLGEVLRDYHKFPQKHPELKWLGNMELNSAVIYRGCQGVTRLGRVLYFQTAHHIERAVNARYDALNRPDEIRRPGYEDGYLVTDTPVVHIAASVCGGTGSGLLIDLAYALQDWGREKFPQIPEVIAHLILPEAFVINAPRIQDKLRAVAASTLEQIELMMDSRRPDIYTRFNTSTRLYEALRAPFTACYLINGFGPGGGDDRQNLVEMVGRMIRAMTVEPVSKEIASELNNEQLNVLSGVERTTQRRTCFSSYGLRYGTAGASADSMEAETARVRRWICESIGRIAAPHLPADDKLKRQIVDILQRECGEGTLLGKLSEVPAQAYAWPVNVPGTSGAQDQLTQSTDLHVDSEATALDASVQKAVASDDEIEQLLRNVEQNDDLTKIGLAVADNPLAVFSSRHLVLSLATTVLREMQNTYNTDKPDLQVAKRQTVDAMRRVIRERAARARVNLDNLPKMGPAVLNKLGDQGLQEKFPLLRRAVAGPYYEKSLERLRAAFEERAKDYERLAEAAARELLRMSSAEAKSDRPPPSQHSPYATPLFELHHPDVGSDVPKEIVKEFHGQFTVPISVSMLKEPRRDESLDQSAHRLEQVLRQYADRIPPFLQNYRDRQSVEFRRPVDAGDASLHPFFKAVSNVASRASAKIAIDEKGRYEPPLDVVISQHPRNCCVHQLLAAMGFDHREAWVSHAHGEKSLIWFQLARFAFGFSLPAVDNYEPYVEARKRYICQSRFTLDDLALDTAWARYYRVLCNNCERELTPVSRDGEATDGAPPRPGSESPAGARLVDRLHVAADVLFSNLNERWKGHGNFASPSGAADCLSMIAETQVAIRHLFDTAGGDGAETLPSKQLLNEVVAQAEGLRAGLNNVDADFTVAVDSLFSDFTHSLS